MNAVQRVFGPILFASLSLSPCLSDAQTQRTQQRAENFRELEATLQRESSNSPVLAPVDRSARAADPVPKATTKAEKRARFAAEERAFQRESTSMAPSMRVDRSTPAADPIPPARTRAAKRQRFIEEEKFLQSETP
jgi:hypothetical protein